MHDKPAGLAAAQHAGVDHAGADSVRFRGVTIAFGLTGGGQYAAVAPTDLAVGAHEFVAIVGPTGCGKSTLLNVAAGLLRPSSGSIRVFGRRARGPQYGGGLSVPAGRGDAVEDGARQRRHRPRGRGASHAAKPCEQAQAWLERVGLRAFGDRYPHQLSGGQRKRVGLAQVLIRDPKILLMDEPFGPLDAQTRQIMGNLLLELWAGDRKAVLFVTHDLEEAIALADRVVIMSAGPGARIIGDHAIDLPRPRDASEVRLIPRFHELHKAIWSQLRAEVLKAYGGEVA